MVLQAARADVKAVYSQVHPSDYTASPKVVNLLPQQFIVNRRENQPSSITLPHGHKILLQLLLLILMSLRTSWNNFTKCIFWSKGSCLK